MEKHREIMDELDYITDHEGFVKPVWICGFHVLL